MIFLIIVISQLRNFLMHLSKTTIYRRYVVDRRSMEETKCDKFKKFWGNRRMGNTSGIFREVWWCWIEAMRVIVRTHGGKKARQAGCGFHFRKNTDSAPRSFAINPIEDLDKIVDRTESRAIEWKKRNPKNSWQIWRFIRIHESIDRSFVDVDFQRVYKKFCARTKKLEQIL